VENEDYVEATLDQIVKDPSKELALEMFRFLLPKAEVDTTIILSALSMVLATVAVEAGMPEEKAVYAFRKSYGNAKRRLKQVLKQTQH